LTTSMIENNTTLLNQTTQEYYANKSGKAYLEMLSLDHG